MRFTKIPLIATLMAVALSLLIVLPALAVNNERTDGRLNQGSIEIGVFDDIGDAQLSKFADPDTGDNYDIFTPVTGTPSQDLGQTNDQHMPANETAYLRNRASSPQDTNFRGTLYVSNNVSGYNTVLVNYTFADTATTAQEATCKVDSDNNLTKDANVTATVRNNRSGNDITMQLVATNVTADGNHSQAFFKVVHKDIPDYDDDNGTPGDPTDDIKYKYTEHDGPTWCADITTFDHDNDSTTPAVQRETRATSGVYFPTSEARATTSPFAKPGPQEIATIFASHGDRLTVTVGNDQIDLIVDGEGPEFAAITPEDNTVTRGSKLTFSFEVRDEDSGLRHDGQGVITRDGDYKEVNADGDQTLDGEPLAVASGSAVDTNGRAADIQVYVEENPTDGSTQAFAVADDIGASGSWKKAVARAGVAYEFTASGGFGKGPYLYQLVAKDRAGNVTTTDAVADTDTNTDDEPFVFRVDNTAPVLVKARTGIGYDTTKNVEKADRNFIALDFGGDALMSVDTSNITVVGHEIKGVVHPSKAPAIDRNDADARKPVAGEEENPGNAPAVVAKPADKTRTNFTRPDDSTINATNTTITLANTCDPTTEPTATTTHDYVVNSTITPTNATSEETVFCDSWDTYQTYLAEKAKYDDDLTAYNNFLQYEREHPGKDIEGGYIMEPRALVYLELDEDLAPDAQPSVIAVGGAVTDLAGNTNEAETLSKSNNKVEDWIAPTLTVTVNGTADDRPVANEDGSFTVDVMADEDLNRRPVVYFVSITEMAVKDDNDKITGYTYKINTVQTASSLTQQEADDHWQKKYKASGIQGTLGEGLIGVIALAEDASDNSGATAGWSPKTHRDALAPAATNKLDLSKMDKAKLLIEIDYFFNRNNRDSDNNSIVAKIGTVTPRSDDDGMETESANPFVKLVFDEEADEYSTGDFDDSHDTVTVTSITLDGANASGSLNRVSATQYSLITRDLAVGKHTVEYKAEDDAGNEYEGKFEFEVKERQPYKVSVQPGWNLVSLPATPLEPAIGDVLSGNSYITPVLGYQQGDWLTAIQEEDGTWRGRLAEFEGGYGYWIHARTFSTVETMLAEVDPAATLPTVPVTAGWNLLGVLDIFQNAEDTPPGGKATDGSIPAGNHEADNYFGSIPWRVAYTYDTTKSLWIKTTPKDGAGSDPMEILNGNGYWVWSPTPATLVP